MQIMELFVILMHMWIYSTLTQIYTDTSTHGVHTYFIDMTEYVHKVFPDILLKGER